MRLFSASASVYADVMETPLARLARFQSLLLKSGSASAVLEDWVGRKRGRVCRLEARKVGGPERPGAAEQCIRLSVGDEDALHHRRVLLVAAGRVLSVADNWYVPSRLLPEMLTELTHSMTPFGTAIAELKPRRQTLSIQHLARLEAFEESQRLPPWLLRVDALVIDRHGQPLCEVKEIYSRNILI